MDAKYTYLSNPEIYFKDCFRKNRTVHCQKRQFIQSGVDITEDVYLHVFPTQREARANKDSFFGVGLLLPDNPEEVVQEVRVRVSKGNETIPSERFISSHMDTSIIRIIRYAHFNVTFEDVVISYVFDGEYTLAIADKTYKLTKGNAIIIAPNTAYSSIIDNDDTIVFNLMIRANTFSTAFLNLITENNYISRFFINMLFNPQHLPYAVVKAQPDDRLSDILLQLFELQENGSFSAAMSNALAQLFICRLFYYYEDCIRNKELFGRNDILVADIVSYLHKNFSTTSLQDVSDSFALSAKYLSRVLKEKVGMSYISIITEIKLEKAREFLRSTDMSIEDICHFVGYSDPRQLRIVYGQKYGMSPSEYRKKVKSGEVVS